MSRVPITFEGEIALKDELSKLKFVERPKISEAIAEARALASAIASDIFGLSTNLSLDNSSLRAISPSNVIGTRDIFFIIATMAKNYVFLGVSYMTNLLLYH